MNVVHCNIFDPSKTIFKSVKKDPAECRTVTCSAESCQLRDGGQCMLVSVFGCHSCSYGKRSLETGPTTRSSKLSAWVEAQKEKYKGVGCLKDPENKLAFIGNYVYVPYPHANSENGMEGAWGEKKSDIPFLCLSQPFSSGSPLIKKTDWTLETVIKIVDFRPRAVFGGEITSYQQKSVPTFIAHLREVDPQMYAALIKARPELDKTPDYTGRKAYVNTLKAGITIPAYDNRYPVIWNWDGEFLTTTSEHSYEKTWGNIKAEAVELKIKPSVDATVRVADNSWVTSQTKFQD